MGDANNFSGNGVNGQGSDDRNLPSDREDTGLAALEGLTLEQLAAIASKEIGEARQFQAEAVGLSRRSTLTLYRAGRTLWCARKKLKGKGKRAWTKWQKSHGIPVTSAWQAIRLYEEAESEEAVAGLTRSQALQKYKITKARKKAEQVPVMGEATVASAPKVSTAELRLVTEQEGAVVEYSSNLDVPTTVPVEQVESTQDSSTTPPAAEILVQIVRRLEILEQDTQGIALSDEALVQIDQAIVTLRRLRGDAATETEAA